MENLTLRLEEDKIEELTQEAEQAGVSRSEYIRTILRNRDTDPESDEDTVSQAEYSAIQAQCAMLMQTVSTLQEQVDRLTDENERLTRQLEADDTPAIEDGETSGVFSRIRGLLG